MNYDTAAMIMMSGGSSTPTTPMSLDEINALYTRATITIGSFVIEIKDLCQFFSGEIDGQPSENGGSILYQRNFSAVINKSVAVIDIFDGLQEQYSYGEYIYEGNYYTKWSNTLYDYYISNINVVPDYYDIFPNIYIEAYYLTESKYDNTSAGVSNSQHYQHTIVWDTPSPLFTKFNDREYLDFARTFTIESKIYEPVINITN